MRVAFLLLFSIFAILGQPSGPAEVQGVPQVQAFVRNLPPVKRVAPVWPEEALSRGLPGHVEVLATLDSSGWVTAVEPISGAPIFRQAAVDAVRQWQFEPVIRSGHPVPAMTTTLVVFIMRGQKPTPESFAADETDQEAALKRTIELERQFSRSAQQVFADLEQSLSGADSITRFHRLPALAKAAINAGDLNKATEYANQSFDTTVLPEPLRRMGNGDGVHDGNMVLGLVAMKRGDLPSAQHYLLEAGKTTGSPVLNSFGPNMSLAKALLEAGERDVVLEYFTECRAFWKMHTDTLDAWSAIVRAGGVPDFKANLVY